LFGMATRGPTRRIAFRISVVGKIEAAEADIGDGKPNPGLGVARMRLDRAAEVALSEAVVAGLEGALAEAESS
jgi:hypothetical protein